MGSDGVEAKGTISPQAFWFQHEVSFNYRIKADLLLELVAYSFKTLSSSVDRF